jgi:hypothetical protein
MGCRVGWRMVGGAVGGGPGRVGCEPWPRLTLALRAGAAGVRSGLSPAAARGHGSRPPREVAARAVWLPSS